MMVFEVKKEESEGIMRVLLCLLFSFGLWYLAGLYQIEFFAILFLAQIFFMGCMLAVFLYIKDRLELQLSWNCGSALQGQEIYGKSQVNNKGKLPLIRYRILLEWQNNLTMEQGADVVVGCCLGEDISEVSLVMKEENCGILQIWARWMEISDPVGMFRWRRRFRDREIHSLTILPYNDPFQMTVAESGKTVDFTESSVKAARFRNGGSQEQVVPYVPGEAMGHIHWKLSARHGELLIIQEEKREEKQAALVLYADRWSEKTDGDMNQILGSLSAVLQGFLEEIWTVRLLWETAEGEKKEAFISDRESYEEAMKLMMEEIGERRFHKRDSKCMNWKTFQPENGEMLFWLDETGRLYQEEEWLSE